MKEEKMEVAVFGALNIDITGEATVAFSSGDSLPGQLRFSTGGTGWNIARDCALMGVKTGFFSLLGTDGYRQLILEEARHCTLNIESCRWEDAPNCCFLRLLNADGSLIGSVNDMNLSRRMDEFFIKDMARAAGSAGVIALECNLQAPALHRLTEELGDRPIVADCVSAAKCMRLAPLLPRLHTLKADVSEAEKLSGYAGAERCAAALLKSGPQRVCITLGAEGLLLADRQDMLRFPLLTEGAADSSGSGDAITAALAAALARKMNLEQTAKLALAAAAVTARSCGSVNPDIARLGAYIKAK